MQVTRVVLGARLASVPITKCVCLPFVTGATLRHVMQQDPGLAQVRGEGWRIRKRGERVGERGMEEEGHHQMHLPARRD